MQMRDHSELLTAREYWARELAGETALLVNPEETFAEETAQAQNLARSVGVEVTGEVLPWWVWFGLYKPAHGF